MSNAIPLETKPSPCKPQSLLEVLMAQREMLDRLVTLAQSQGALIADGHTDRLLELLAQRQGIIDEFTASQHLLSELTRRLDHCVDATNANDRARVHTLITEISERLNHIMARDEQDQALLRSSRDHVKRELHSIGTARQATGAYRTVQPPTTRFADQRG